MIFPGTARCSANEAVERQSGWGTIWSMAFLESGPNYSEKREAASLILVTLVHR